MSLQQGAAPRHHPLGILQLSVDAQTPPHCHLSVVSPQGFMRGCCHPEGRREDGRVSCLMAAGLTQTALRRRASGQGAFSLGRPRYVNESSRPPRARTQLDSNSRLNSEEPCSVPTPELDLGERGLPRGAPPGLCPPQSCGGLSLYTQAAPLLEP